MRKQTSSKAQKNYEATELKLHAVIFAVEKFPFYLGGNCPFKIATDHSAIGDVLKTEKPTNGLARWVMRLNAYVFEVVYCPGMKNCLNGGPSRFSVAGANPIQPLNLVPLFFTSKIDFAKLNGIFLPGQY